MSRTTTIECEADIDIDDYLDDASTEALLDELLRRKPTNQKERIILNTVLNSFFEKDDVFELMCKITKLSIIQEEKLRKFINREL
jgi:hypothetical protein